MVFLSGESDPRDHLRFLGAGAARVLVKPASLENLSSLRALVDRALSWGGSTAQVDAYGGSTMTMSNGTIRTAGGGTSRVTAPGGGTVGRSASDQQPLLPV